MRQSACLLISILLLSCGALSAADWPMWRHDAGRTAASPGTLPEALEVIWSRDLPASEPAYQDVRLQFDRVAEPIVVGKRLIVGSNSTDRVAAFDTETGELIWEFATNGPVRFAPVGGEGRVIFGSDDGCVYCLKLRDGSLVWKKRAVPSERLVLGNQRLISVWPIRGGPVLQEGKVYFTAGVWPLEGTFIFCVDAKTGDTIWRNDSSAYLYGIHPHNAEAYGGVAPQGYLLLDGEDLVVPCSQAYPARFNPETGELTDFALPAPGRLPGGWFASTPAEEEALKLRRRGLLFDDEVNKKPHEDKMRSEGVTGVRNTIRTRDTEISFLKKLPGVEGEIGSLLSADGKLFAVTKENRLYALGASSGKPTHHPIDSPSSTGESESPFPREITLPRHGYVVAYGVTDVASLSHIAKGTDLPITSVVPDGEKAQALRGENHLPSKIHVISGSNFTAGGPALSFPPYFASFVWVDESVSLKPEEFAALHKSLRPFGGMLLTKNPEIASLAEQHPDSIAVRTVGDEWSVIERSGSLPGTKNTQADWATSEDQLVKAPFGLLWFGDSVTHFKRSPQPKFIDGVMISNPKDWTDASTRQGKVDYRLLETTFTDAYTGRVLAAEEEPELRQSFSEFDNKTIQPSQYRPPRQKDDWKPDAPRAGERINPMTGETEPRTFPKSYGCDGGFDYGFVYSMRSGTPAVYDKTVESGTINISGPRSGCTNSVVPANGILNLPYFYEGCTCSYPLPMSLALVGMPETFEQWASWGEVPAEELSGKIQRVGLNFGAPGDRATRDGTLWLDIPNVGGPSPAIEVTTDPPLEELSLHYRHSVFLTGGGKGWPWVAGSGVAGAKTVRLDGVKPGTYRIRITSSEISSSGKIPGPLAPDAPAKFSTWDGKEIEVGDDGKLSVELPDSEGKILLLHGMEIILAELPVTEIPKW